MRPSKKRWAAPGGQKRYVNQIVLAAEEVGEKYLYEPQIVLDMGTVMFYFHPVPSQGVGSRAVAPGREAGPEKGSAGRTVALLQPGVQRKLLWSRWLQGPCRRHSVAEAPLHVNPAARMDESSIITAFLHANPSRDGFTERWRNPSAPPPLFHADGHNPGTAGGAAPRIHLYTDHLSSRLRRRRSAL
jgi:hypothetical protein